MRKLLSVLSSTLQGGVRGGLLFVALLATTTLWAYDFQSGDLYYNITSDTTVEVTYQYQWSSDNYAGLTTATIPETVTHDGINYSVTSIGDMAFWDCISLTSITIPNSVTSIGRGAFEYCSSLTSITIPNSVTSIGDDAFGDCHDLTSITIPNSVTSIGYRAFWGCFSLTSIVVESGNSTYDSRENCNAIIETATNTLIAGCQNTIIPNSVTSIGGSAFEGCISLTSITIPNSVTSIESSAFSYCRSLTSITIPNSVTSIGEGAFWDCRSLTSIAIPNSVTSIGDDAFNSCTSLTSITIPNSVTSIGDWAFAGCIFAKENFVNHSVLDAEENNFWGASIVDTEIDGLLIRNNTVIDCRRYVTSVIIPNSVTSIGDVAFADCSSLSSITIPNSVTSIGDRALDGCSSLTSITILNSVTSIGYEAFRNCSALEYLSIPNSVQYYEGDYNNEVYYLDGYSSIYGCYNLKTLIVPADFFAPEDEYDYPDAVEHYLPYLPEKLEALTINSGNMSHRFGWDFINRNRKSLKHIDLGVTENIAEEAFTNFYNLESLVLPSQLETIPYMAVAECVKLKSISIPATVTTIEDRAFENCRMLSSVTFSKNGALTRIGNWAFYNNHELTNLVIPEGVTEVGHAAFYGCTYLKEMTLPSTVQDIADNGFALCAKLQKIHVEATTPPTIQAKTFFDVNRQIPVYVPDNAVEAYKADPYWQEFNIIGKSNAPSAVDNISSPDANTHKLLRDGQLLILRDGKTYTITGQKL